MKIFQFEIQIKDDGVDYNENLDFFSQPQISNIGTVKIIVDFCNLAPEFVSYIQEDIASIQLNEDESLDISTVSLESFEFADPNMAESFDDINGNGIWDNGEDFFDENGNFVKK